MSDKNNSAQLVHEETQLWARQNALEAFHSGDLLLSNAWLNMAQWLAAHPASPNQVMRDTRESSPSPVQSRWSQWWEGRDEIVWLFIGIAISFAGEAIADIWQPSALLLFSFFLFTVVVVYVLIKSLIFHL